MATITGTTNDTLMKLWDWETIYLDGPKTIRISNIDPANSIDYEVHTVVFSGGSDEIYSSGTIAASESTTFYFFKENLNTISIYLKSTGTSLPAGFIVENIITNTDAGFLQNLEVTTIPI